MNDTSAPPNHLDAGRDTDEPAFRLPAKVIGDTIPLSDSPTSPAGEETVEAAVHVLNDRRLAHRSSVTPWGARLAVALPEGVSRHPRLLSRVEQVIGRFCLVDLAGDDVRVAYGLDGPTQLDAEREARFIAEAVLAELGLRPDSVYQSFVRPLHSGPMSEPPTHLRLVEP